MKQNKILGITGGVGSGKSLVLNYLHDKYSAIIIEADKVAKKIYDDNEVRLILKDKLCDYFVNDSLDIKKLSKASFEDEKLLLYLNSLIHPRVKKRVLDIIDKNKGLIVIEAALLIEAGYKDILDELWYVRVNNNLRYDRLKQARGYSKEHFENILSKQLTDDEFASNSDYILDNNGSIMELYKKIDDRIEELMHL